MNHDEIELPSSPPPEAAGKIPQSGCGQEPRNSVANDRIAILVLGMHRSGTSALTRVVSLLGASLPVDIYPPGDGNVMGHWEPCRVWRLNDEILESVGSSVTDWRRLNPGWFMSPPAAAFRKRGVAILLEEFLDASLVVIKDPRLSRLIPFWRAVLSDCGMQARCMIALRNPREVAASLKRRDDAKQADSLVVWLRYILDAELSTRSLPRVFVTYDELLLDWRGTANRVGRCLGVSWPRDSAIAEVEIERFLSHRHRHHTSETEGDERLSGVGDWVEIAYKALLALREDPYSADSQLQLDNVRDEFDRASDALGAVLRAHEMNVESLTERCTQLERQAEQLADAQARIGELVDDLQEARLNAQQIQRLRADCEQLVSKQDLRITELEGLIVKGHPFVDRLNAIQMSAAWEFFLPVAAVERRWPSIVRGFAGITRLAWWTVTRRLGERLRLRREAVAISESGLFDTSWYVHTYPDVVLTGWNPLLHWLTCGLQEGKNPNPWFDVKSYVEKYPGAAANSINPLLHYLSQGSPVLDEPVEIADKCLETERDLQQDAILVIEHRVPTPDKTSGSLRLWGLLKALAKSGRPMMYGSHTMPCDYHWVLDDWENDLPSYIAALKELGSDTLFGSDVIVEHLRISGAQYTAVILSYPEVMYEYAAAVRAFAPHAKLIYDTVDLHGLRLEREAALLGEEGLAERASYYKSIENIGIKIADRVIAITPEERDEILRISPDADVCVVPNIHHIPAQWRSSPIGRQGLLFIGHYLHSPNVDAVEYFVKSIFPLVKARLPDVRFTMLGSTMTDQVRALAGDGVDAIGYVEDPTPYFDQARVFVAPLRFGAGMKGKIGHSMSLGLPVVTSGVGAEGMDLTNGLNVLVEDDAVKFAEMVIRLYTDDELWLSVANAAREHIETNFSPAAVEEAVSTMMSFDDHSLMLAGAGKGGEKANA